VGDSEIDTLLAKLATSGRRRPPIELLTGTRRFELLRRLGGGGFGDVYEARDREHGTRVALKALKSAQPEWIYRFKREFRAVGDLAHPNLARLYELFCEDDQWYLTMELVEGQPFDQYVARAPDQLSAAFAQLALGLAELHRAGCLHRDVKPSNALVEPTGRVVLLDFGLTVQSRGPLQTMVAGTPPYMAPELVGGGEPTTASDWYSFGVMLYEALAGERPFRGTSAEMYEAKRFRRPPSPSEVVPGADPILESLAMRLLDPAPAQRPGAEEILAALEAPPSARGGRVEDSLVVGRQHELELLDQALAVAADQRAALAMVHGHPGMGKSVVLRAFAAGARARGVQVFEGRCHETEALPYKGIDGIIDAVCNHLSYRDRHEVADLVPPGAGALVQMFPVFKRVGAFARARWRASTAASAHDSRRAAAAALRELWVRMTGSTRVVLIIDDLQWASDDTIGLLLELLAVPAPPLCVVVAFRRDAIGSAPALDRFLDAANTLPGLERFEVPVDALDQDAVGELLAGREGVTLSATEALRETGGHPFLLSRLLDDQGWTSDRVTDISTLLSAQLAALAPEARRLLEAVAVAGAPVGRAVAFAAAGVERDPAIIDELRRQKLVHSLASGPEAPIEAYHDRIREIAVAELPGDRRRTLHAQLARALERVGGPEPDALARHYRLAGDLDRAVYWTRRAARRAAEALAFARAVELYQELLGMDLGEARRVPILEELAEAQVQCGRRNDAGLGCLAAAELAATIGDLDRQAGLLARAGEHFLLGGHLERGLELLRGALAEVGVVLPVDDAVAVAESFNVGAALATRGLEFRPREPEEVPPALLRRLDLELAVARALMLTDLRAPLIASLALTDALEAGDRLRLQRALAYFVIGNSARAPEHELVALAERRAAALAAELGDELSRGWAAFAEGMRSLQRAAFIDALDALREAERRFSTNGPALAREVAIARIAAVVACGSFGVDIPYARRTHRGCVEEARSRGDVFAATWAVNAHCWLELVGGDVPAARMRLDESRNAWPRAADSLFAVVSLLNELGIVLYEDPSTAWERSERLRADFQRLFSSLMPMPRSSYARQVAIMALAAFQAGRAGREETLARIEPLVDLVPDLPYGVSTRHVLRGLIHLVSGDRAAAVAELEQGEAGWRAGHQSGQALSVKLRLCQLAGDTEGARRAAAQLRDITVADPDRFAVLFAGPPPASS
jgi:eukaryotic-like serine/threonine-protein kinase